MDDKQLTPFLTKKVRIVTSSGHVYTGQVLKLLEGGLQLQYEWKGSLGASQQISIVAEAIESITEYLER